MKAIRIARYGEPTDVVTVDSIPEPAAPGTDEVNVVVEYAPVHPSDLLMIRGGAGRRPTMPATLGQLPAVLGTEGVGRVTAVGPGVATVAVGDRVLTPFNYPSWAEVVTVPARRLFPIPEGFDGPQLSMLTINPLTAYVMLREFVALAPGDWVIQNAANSGVGRAVIAIAKAWGLRTVNVVRRPELVGELIALGADVVLLEGADLRERVSLATGGAEIKLGLDAVAGEATTSMAASLSAGATLVSYGAMSGTPCALPPRLLIVNDLIVRGFWLVSWMERVSPEAMIQIQRELLTLVDSGGLFIPVSAVVPLADATTAMRHAVSGQGKIVIAVCG